MMPKEKVHVWGYLLCKLGANCVHGLRYTPKRKEPLDAIGKVSIPAFKNWEYKPGAMYISVGKAAMAILQVTFFSLLITIKLVEADLGDCSWYETPGGFIIKNIGQSAAALPNQATAGTTHQATRRDCQSSY